jgi:hypothetical protein
MPKLAWSEKLEEHLAKSLLSLATKFVTGLVGRRIEGRTGGNPSENNFGFRENRGPQDAILCFRMLIEKMIQMCKPL